MSKLANFKLILRISLWNFILIWKIFDGKKKAELISQIQCVWSLNDAIDTRCIDPVRYLPKECWIQNQRKFIQYFIAFDTRTLPRNSKSEKEKTFAGVSFEDIEKTKLEKQKSINCSESIDFAVHGWNRQFNFEILWEI